MDWFSLLSRIRKISGPFETAAIAGVGLTAKDASAWISKFIKWGYVKRIGSSENEGRKPKGVYEITDYGRSVAPKHVNRLFLMLEASESLKEARGKRTEQAAMDSLFKLTNEIRNAIEESKESRRKK